MGIGRSDYYILSSGRAMFSIQVMYKKWERITVWNNELFVTPVQKKYDLHPAVECGIVKCGLVLNSGKLPQNYIGLGAARLGSYSSTCNDSEAVKGLWS